ncbi:carbon-nitrogen hydrolase family protein [Micromonospora endophytica]|uniref:carbon-nitrogen hydrolase family protein n=1 Tax=Micromonospora endophytica TaxID=515350 RepID=UPI001BB398BA|nr:carbon-nitrogen hydrolase family protein [Micromonospora endophytica]BCJ60713.1 hypothetical protein Jiend_41350 [Micromonospora endophytica]
MAVTTMPSGPLTVAAVQVEAGSGDVAGNARRAAERVVAAADGGARIVVLPELHLCGYDLPALAANSDAEVRADAAGRVTDCRLAPLVGAATEHAVTVVLGAAVRRADGQLANSLLVVGDDGSVRVGYDKQHLWRDEQELFTPGRAPAWIDVDTWRLGLAICYDMSFPEHCRRAALDGAHAYLCPSAFAAGAEHRAAVYLRARALENTIFTVFVNPVAGPPSRPCAGTSAVHGPMGELLGAAPAAAEAMVLARLEPITLRSARAQLRMLAELSREIDCLTNAISVDVRGDGGRNDADSCAAGRC